MDKSNRASEVFAYVMTFFLLWTVSVVILLVVIFGLIKFGFWLFG